MHEVDGEGVDDGKLEKFVEHVDGFQRWRLLGFAFLPPSNDCSTNINFDLCSH